MAAIGFPEWCKSIGGVHPDDYDLLRNCWIAATKHAEALKSSHNSSSVEIAARAIVSQWDDDHSEMKSVVMWMRERSAV